MATAQSDHIRQAVDLRNRRPRSAKAIDWIRTKPEGGITVLGKGELAQP